MPPSKAISLFLILLPNAVFASIADDFYCRASACEIPYNDQGIQNGLEICYTNRDKKLKAKEVTWKNGLRQGKARCYKDGEVTFEAYFEKNRLHGLFVQKNYDSTGDRYIRVVDGRQVGFSFSVDAKKKMYFRGCHRDNGRDDLAIKDCLKGDYGPFTKEVMAEYQIIKDKEKRDAATQKARRDGPQLEKFPNGQIRVRYTNKDGQPTGRYEEFHQNGKPALTEYFSSTGKRDGESKEWNAQGVLKKLTVYDNGSKTSETEFRDNGQPQLLVIWEGKGFDRSPCLTYFYESGKKQSSECRLPSPNWYEPMHGEYVYWNEDGKEVVKGRYERGVRAGTWKYFDDQEGRLSQEHFFEKGRLVRSVHYVGPEKVTREFHPDGSLKSEKKSTVGGA